MCWRRRSLCCRPGFISALRGTQERGYFWFDERQQIQTYVSVAALMPWQMIILWPQNMNIEHFIFRVEFSCVRKGVFGWFCASIFCCSRNPPYSYTVFNDDSWRTQCVIQFSFAVQCAVESRHLAVSTMTSMQQMNPFSRINNKWICFVSLWSLSLWLGLEFCCIFRCIFCGLCFYALSQCPNLDVVLTSSGWFYRKLARSTRRDECMSWWGAFASQFHLFKWSWTT